MVILNFLAAPRTGRARDLGEQENCGEAFQKTDTYANLALVNYRKNISTKSLLFSEGCKNEMLIIHKVISFLRLYFLGYLSNRAYYFMAIFKLTKVAQL